MKNVKIVWMGVALALMALWAIAQSGPEQLQPSSGGGIATINGFGTNLFVSNSVASSRAFEVQAVGGTTNNTWFQLGIGGTNVVWLDRNGTLYSFPRAVTGATNQVWINTFNGSSFLSVLPGVATTWSFRHGVSNVWTVDGPAGNWSTPGSVATTTGYYSASNNVAAATIEATISEGGGWTGIISNGWHMAWKSNSVVQWKRMTP